MGILNVVHQFERMGAELRIEELNMRLRENRNSDRQYSLDVKEDRFVLSLRSDAEVEFAVPHFLQKQRHLLLHVATADHKEKFLCGHDERHWFAAGLPRNRTIRTVEDAMENLKPQPVRVLQRNDHTKDRNRRKNTTFIRQGEWFFVPMENLQPSKLLIRSWEPISRPGGKPHMVEELYRTAGTLVLVNQKGNILRPEEYEKAVSLKPSGQVARDKSWAYRRVGAEVYARGRVRHVDHATITLHGWHQIHMNEESAEVRGKSLVFLD
jgi:hypothetical protein